MSANIERAKSLVALFLRRGEASEATGPFDRFAREIQNRVRAICRIAEDETPAVLFYRSEDHLCLLTSNRLYYVYGADRKALNCSQIEDVTVDVASQVAAGARSKSDFTDLMVKLRGGETITVQVEAGPPFSGFWNAVSMAGQMNASRTA